MKLNELIKGLEVEEINGSIDIDILDIAYDSRKAVLNSLFVCIEGFKVDGHKFVNSAIDNGAKALIVEKDVDVSENITVIRVKNSRFALAYVADSLYNHPSKKFNLIGITGTKGKTTTTYMIKSILEAEDKKVGLIGTLGSSVGEEKLQSERTTPESYDLQAIFSEMVSKNVNDVVMEVSSQGLVLHRVSCCDFNIGVFNNLSRDHIGPNEHKDMEDYLNAKIKLFKMCKKAIINIDNEYSNRVIDGCDCEFLTFGINKRADIHATDIITYPDHVEFKVSSPWWSEIIKVNVPGMFSVYNTLGAICVCGLMGISLKSIKKGLQNINVPGRAEVVETGKDFNIIIDYAHTPDSLENILTTIKNYAPGRVVSVFGCGGDRDRNKRPMMGEISGKIADFTIITSDNPRTEEPLSILKDIEEGIKNTGNAYIIIEDRTEAIRYAIKNSKPQDIILLAGKGHETYQMFKDKTIHYDEREIVRDILKEL